MADFTVASFHRPILIISTFLSIIFSTGEMECGAVGGMTTVEELRHRAKTEYYAVIKVLLLKSSAEIEALQKERDALKIEYESRAIWIAKMLKALDCENHDGFHCVDAHEVATNIRAKIEALQKHAEHLQTTLDKKQIENATLRAQNQELRESLSQLTVAAKQIEQGAMFTLMDMGDHGKEMLMNLHKAIDAAMKEKK